MFRIRPGATAIIEPVVCRQAVIHVERSGRRLTASTIALDVLQKLDFNRRWRLRNFLLSSKLLLERRS